MLSHTEENYLKCIYKLQQESSSAALTNHISAAMRTTAGTVTDMVRRLSEKNLVHYEKYKGVTLSEQGLTQATQLVRKHRLWEVFLHEKLGFAWHEVHDIAEELEHITSEALVERLDHYLGKPQFDPHGDPIPDADGRVHVRKQVPLADAESHKIYVVTGVQEHSADFLQYLEVAGLTLGAEITVGQTIPYDKSREVTPTGRSAMMVSEKVCRNLFVQSLKNEKTI
jgi:DtxR family transcriptional regulator, Mn-dependent transcriptional regulator